MLARTPLELIGIAFMLAACVTALLSVSLAGRQQHGAVQDRMLLTSLMVALGALSLVASWVFS